MSYQRLCNKVHNENSIFRNSRSIYWFVLFTFVFSVSIIYLDSLKNNTKITKNRVFNTKIVAPSANISDILDDCSGKYIYVQELPKQFNNDLLKNCRTLNTWVDMCKYLTNFGLGPRLNDSKHTVFSSSNWFATNQFSLEVIFHNRMKHYKCLTNDSSKANAVFVPFYAGLDIGRYLWNTDVKTRDFASIELVKYLREKPEWSRMYGRDHFLVAGRITWDFRRNSEKETDWGNRLFLLPEVKNMTTLIIESSPWSNTDFAIPYPTYFHPSSDNQVYNWQKRMRRQKRPYLFSFAGASRPQLNDSIRNDIIEQCLGSKCKCCKFMNCASSTSNCDEPRNVMRLFQKSVFCLQPAGDSYTRRSAFDSILAGCIPVFFHPGSAYVQYVWHLPNDYSSYSVFIPIEEVKQGNDTIEKRLLSISKKRIKAMRDEVIKLIPRVVYANPNSRLENVEDAFDVSVTEVLNKVEKIRTNNNMTYEKNFPEEYSWKSKLIGGLDNHEWDRYFNR